MGREEDLAMAFTLQIRQKKIFGKTVLDLPSPTHACGLNYGSNNELYIHTNLGLLQKGDTGEMGDFYVLTAGFIQFVSYEEQHMVEDMYSYGHFMEELQRRCPSVWRRPHSGSASE